MQSMLPFLALALALLVACSSSKDDSSAAPPEAPSTRTVISVSGYFGGDVHLYDEHGEPIGVLEGVDGAQTVVLSPDGELVVCAEGLNQVLRYDATTFAPLGVLVDGSAGFDGPTAAVYGPDGRLYVASFNDDRVVRFEADGTYVDDVLSAGEGGLDGPDIGMAFGPDGALYVPSWYTGAVLAYAAGELTTVIGADEPWSDPRGIAWDADGAMLVAMNGEGEVVRVQAGISTLLEQRRAAGLAVLGDLLLVGSDASDKVEAFDLMTGVSAGVFVDDDAIDGATAISVMALPVP